MRGYFRTWERSNSAARRGESTCFRVKNALVHSSSRLTVHGPATGVCMRWIVGGGVGGENMASRAGHRIRQLNRRDDRAEAWGGARDCKGSAPHNLGGSQLPLGLVPANYLANSITPGAY